LNFTNLVGPVNITTSHKMLPYIKVSNYEDGTTNIEQVLKFISYGCNEQRIIVNTELNKKPDRREQGTIRSIIHIFLSA